jgi:hypothetical protein
MTERWELFAALVPLNTDRTAAGQAMLVGHADQDQQRLFYNSLLELPWLAAGVRRAVMVELGLSLRKQNVKIEHARTATLKVLIAEAEAHMRANGERPRGGIHDAAVAAVARQKGMTVEALTKRLHRARRAK